jgi:hypothetical protein
MCTASCSSNCKCQLLFSAHRGQVSCPGCCFGSALGAGVLLQLGAGVLLQLGAGVLLQLGAGVLVCWVLLSRGQVSCPGHWFGLVVGK